MWFWWFMSCCDLLIPISMIIAGRIMWKYPPKEINTIVGYRTARSMKNMDTWNFAHDYCGRLWWKTGWIILLPSIIVHIAFYNATDNVIGMVGVILMAVQAIALLGSLFPTERALKRTFTELGIRR